MSSVTHTKAASVEATVKFEDLGVSEEFLNMLDKNGFVTPTPIQHKVIPIGLEGKDVIGIAQTGTGKTLGFGLPMLMRLRGKKGQGLVLLPTRELALQVNETLKKVGGPLGLFTAVLIGGEPMGRQVRDIRYDPNVIVATPGRLIDHLKQGTLKLDRVSVLVLDEADHMFDIGFAPQIREIIARVPKERQTMLFSATMPDEIAKLAMEHMKLPLRIEVAPAGTASERVDQEIIVVDRGAKFSLLEKLLAEREGSVLVFSRTKHGAGHIARDLRSIGVTAAEIHSNRSLGQRRAALDGFKRGEYRVLVATDIAARGIDVKNISLVVNYDLPEQSEDYVHRIGRTGRAGAEGKAVSFATPDQKREIVAIERLIKKTIPTTSHEGAVMHEGAGGGYRRGGRGGGHGSSYGRGGFGGRRAGGFSRGYRGGDRAGHGAPRSADRGFGARPIGHAAIGGRQPRLRGRNTDQSTSTAIGTGYRRVFRKGVR